MKPIVASAGDKVKVTSWGISVNGKLLPNSAPRGLDTYQRSMPQWPAGEYLVKPGTVWVISSFNDRSFDSRYFGPIYLSSTLHRLKATSITY